MGISCRVQTCHFLTCNSSQAEIWHPKAKLIMRLFSCSALGAAGAERTRKLIQACTHPLNDILWFYLWVEVPGILSQQPLRHTSANSCRSKALSRDASPSDVLPSLETETSLSLQEKTDQWGCNGKSGRKTGSSVAWALLHKFLPHSACLL